MIMHIGLDFDETITENPALWLECVRLFQNAKWTVSVVSIRPNNQENQDVLDFAALANVTAYFTDGKQKSTFMKAQGCPVNIWIDDAPELIPDPTTLKGVLVGCILFGEEVDPHNEIDADIVIKK
jgi:hypothetical protein